MDTDELIEEIKQILEAVDEGKMSGMEATHTIYVLTNPHEDSKPDNLENENPHSVRCPSCRTKIELKVRKTESGIDIKANG
ncbi:hypothetical protein KAU43_03705 [candidate division WOR-3 bacterium]|nr:hypothetical protein [candidate division WOR-3 bacterium]